MAKVLFTIGSLEVGGAESQMVLLIEGLTRLGHQCAVVALSADGPLRQRLKEAGVPLIDCMLSPEQQRRSKLLTLARGFVRLWWFAVRFRPHVLHAYLPLTNLLGAIAGRLALVPVIVTSRRALGKHQDVSNWWRFLDRVTNLLSTSITANSLAVMEDTIARDRVTPDKLHLIHNGINFELFDKTYEIRQQTRSELGLQLDHPYIAVIGNLIPYKGHADLIDAIARLKPRSKPARFLIVGHDRGIGSDLVDRAAKLGVLGQISFLGSRTDVPAILAVADGFVLPSHQEGFSNALLEAMAAGLPIIATDVGGNGEALDRGRYGTLVPAHDPKALAGAIDTMLNSPDTARERGRLAALAARERYGTDGMIHAHLMLYGLISRRTY